jgi:phage host-nuclease inhibitor protein Gam
LSAKTDLEQAASDAADVIARSASEAVKAIAEAASEALRATSVKNDNDHDILIEVRTKLEGLKKDIQDLKDGTSTQISDHETRIVNLEASRTKQIVITSIGTGLLSLLASLVTYHILK